MNNNSNTNSYMNNYMNNYAHLAKRYFSSRNELTTDPVRHKDTFYVSPAIMQSVISPRPLVQASNSCNETNAKLVRV